MASAAGFEPATVRLDLWRAVEAQHVVSTMALVDTLAEQELLERLLEGTKPAVPPAARHLHYLLFTPFRYPPTMIGSRFRRATDPGVFYGAETIRTACAEVGYWRWRFLLDSRGLDRIDARPQTVFKARVRARAIDLRVPPLSRRRAQWTRPNDYGACQALADDARDAGVGVIRYQSVRDPEAGGAAAVLTPEAFSRPEPLAQETWFVDVTSDRVRWTRPEPDGGAAGYDFSTTRWRESLPTG